MTVFDVLIIWKTFVAGSLRLRYTLHKGEFFMWIKDVRDYIIYEDKEILVCHKPAGIAVQSAGVGNMDLESLLKGILPRNSQGKCASLGVIHRLDQPVEEVVVFALNPKAAAALNRQMTSGQIRKTYLAVTAGDLPGKEGGTGGLAEERRQDEYLPGSKGKEQKVRKGYALLETSGD